MHHVYHTRAFVLGGVPRGEANRLVRLFTKELGLVSIAAQGIRLNQSKLRYSLQDYSLVNVSLVRGKDVWRLTSVREEEKLLYQSHRPALLLFARILGLISRFVGEDEKNEALFGIVEQLFFFMNSSSEFSQEFIKNVESIAVLKILHNLGYGEEKPQLKQFVERGITADLVQKMSPERRLAVSVINSALKESHL